MRFESFVVLLHVTSTLFVLGLFMKAFFPLKSTFPLNSYDYIKQSEAEHEKSTGSNVKHKGAEGQDFGNQSHIDDITQIAESSNLHYQRMVLMVIDAFRADFMFGPLRYMPSTHDILNSGHGLKFTAETSPPTVTLPRLKAMVTGSTSSFADVVLNFGSPALEEDNIISQLKSHNRKSIFFGDDTWLRLFPSHFDRSDGTTSFFVSDYTEVDNNVTRHLKSELEDPDWDVMILHYLGLDHIGHIAGPRSPLIQPKLAEMDKIIQQIYNSMEEWDVPSLLVVCGDHGMSDQGGHGGASPGEISVPVLFLSPELSISNPIHSGTVAQTDICPTLAVLLGLPIPGNSIGKVITETLVGYSLEQKVNILHHNAIQALRVLEVSSPDMQRESAYILFSETEKKFNSWYKLKSKTSQQTWRSQGHALLSAYTESLNLISEKVSKMATKYDVYAMAISIVLMWMIFVSLVLTFVQNQKHTTSSKTIPWHGYIGRTLPVVGSATLSHILMCTGGVPSDLVCSPTTTSILIQVGAALNFLGLAVNILTMWPSFGMLWTYFKTLWHDSKLSELLLLVGWIAHTVSLLSSSFVEEEHQTFFYLSVTVHLLLALQVVEDFISSRSTVRAQEVLEKKSSIISSDKLSTKEKKTYDLLQSYSHYEERDSFFQEKGNDPNDADYAANFIEQSDYNLQENSDNVGTYGHSSSTQNTNQSFSDVQAEDHINEPGSRNGKHAPFHPDDLSNRNLMHCLISLLVVLAMLRILRRWNHTGNKWLDMPDFGDWLVKPENKEYLSLLTVFSFLIIGASRGLYVKRYQSLCINLSLSCAYLSRAAQGSLLFPFSIHYLSSSGLLEARASYLFIIINIIISIVPQQFFTLEEQPKSKSPRKQSEKSNGKQRKSKAICDFDKKTNCSDGKPTIDCLPSLSSIVDGNENDAEENFSISAQPSKNSVSKQHSENKVDTKDAKQDSEEEFSVHQRLKGVMAAVVCFACLVKQPHNAPVMAAMALTEQIMTPLIAQINFKPVYSLLYTVLMGHVFFFLQGNSNSLSTIDIAASYVGLDSYWPMINGLLLFMTTYVANIFWALAFLNFLCLKVNQISVSWKNPLSSGVMENCCLTLLLTRVMPLSVYIALVSALRYHLFVWSVFSPKLLYEGTSTVVVAGQILIYLCFNAVKE